MYGHFNFFSGVCEAIVRRNFKYEYTADKILNLF